MKIIVIGAVGSTKRLLEEMIQMDIPIHLVFSLDEKVAKNVSGYVPLHDFAKANGIPYKKFTRINDKENIEIIKSISPDYIFALGFSQLISKEIISSARKGVLGLHPTPLPKLRGRASIPWQILLGIRESKVTMFFIDEGADSGDIIAQEDYLIAENDYAMDVLEKTAEATRKLYRRVLTMIKNGGIVNVIKQNEEEATYTLKRTPEDGRIDWNLPVKDIQRLVRAVSKPYPGAFTYYDNKHKIIIWKADYLKNNKYIGIPGQIAKKTDEYFDVVGVDGLLRVYTFDNPESVKILEGHRLY